MQTTKQAAVIAAVARNLLAILLITFLAGAFTASAQERFGNIRGQVRDATGAVLPEAAVTVTNRETGRVYRTTTTGEGSFMAQELPPGNYSVAVEKTGFSRFEVPQVLVQFLDAALMASQREVSGAVDVGGEEHHRQHSGHEALWTMSSASLSDPVMR